MSALRSCECGPCKLHGVLLQRTGNNDLNLQGNGVVSDPLSLLLLKNKTKLNKAPLSGHKKGLLDPQGCNQSYRRQHQSKAEEKPLLVPLAWIQLTTHLLWKLCLWVWPQVNWPIRSHDDGKCWRLIYVFNFFIQGKAMMWSHLIYNKSDL